MRNLNLELLIISFCLVGIILLFLHIPLADKIVVIAFALLSAYYLLSGVLVLFNKKVIRGMRLLYFLGLWGISVGVIGILYKLKFWVGSVYLLLFAFTFALAVMVFIMLYWKSSKSDHQVTLKEQLQPLFWRLLIFPIIFFLVYAIPNRPLYMELGEYSDDPVYVDLFIEALENPADMQIQNELEEYRQKKYGGEDDDQRSTEPGRSLD